MEITSFGSLYVGGVPVPARHIVGDNPVISLGNSSPGMEIVWAFNGKMYVASRCACVGASWESLNHAQRGPVSPAGKLVLIDGSPYRSWLLADSNTVKYGAPCTWPEILHDAEECGIPELEDGSFWNTKDEAFWGQDAIGYGSHIVWGQGKPWESWHACSNERAYGIGYRPALEPLQVLELDKGLKKKCLKIYGKDGYVMVGWYLDSDDYDLIFKRKVGSPFDCSWAKGDLDTMIIDRDAIAWIEKADERTL